MTNRTTFVSVNAGDALMDGYFNGAFWAVCPIGTVVAWCKSMTGVPALKDGWVECDGSVISDADSPMNGQAVPNLNATARFLRGNTTSAGVGGTSVHQHTFLGAVGGGLISDGSGYYTYTTLANHEPQYYDVVWVMRIK